MVDYLWNGEMDCGWDGLENKVVETSLRFKNEMLEIVAYSPNREALYVEKSIISYYENDKKEMRASGLAEIAKVLQTMPNYLLGFADNNDGFADEALGLLRDVKDQSVREILLKQIRALI